MNNLIKSEWFMFKKKGRVTAAFCLMVGYAAVFFGGLIDNGHVSKSFTSQSLGNGSTMAIMIVTMIASAAIAGGYLSRIQIYEIMSGFSPNQILLGRAAFYVPLLIMLYLVPVFAVMLIIDSSTEMLLTLILFGILFIRFLLCTVFLSVLFKEGAWITSLTALIILIKPAYEKLTASAAAFDNSVFGLTAVGQCAMLAEPITSEFIVKVVVSSMVSCVICYLIGHFTLKKKYDLEPHTIV